MFLAVTVRSVWMLAQALLYIVQAPEVQWRCPSLAAPVLGRIGMSRARASARPESHPPLFGGRGREWEVSGPLAARKGPSQVLLFCVFFYGRPRRRRSSSLWRSGVLLRELLRHRSSALKTRSQAPAGRGRALDPPCAPRRAPCLGADARAPAFQTSSWFRSLGPVTCQVGQDPKPSLVVVATAPVLLNRAQLRGLSLQGQACEQRRSDRDIRLLRRSQRPCACEITDASAPAHLGRSFLASAERLRSLSSTSGHAATPLPNLNKCSTTCAAAHSPGRLGEVLAEDGLSWVWVSGLFRQDFREKLLRQ